MYKQVLIKAKLQIGKRGQGTELSGRHPFMRRRSALDWTVLSSKKKEKK